MVLIPRSDRPVLATLAPRKSPVKPWEKDHKTQCLGACRLGDGGPQGSKKAVSSERERPKARLLLSAWLTLVFFMLRI